MSTEPLISYSRVPGNLYGCPNPSLAGGDRDFDAETEAVLPERYAGFGPDNCFGVVRQGDGRSVMRPGNNAVYIDCEDQYIDPGSWWDNSPAGDRDSDDPNNY